VQCLPPAAPPPPEAFYLRRISNDRFFTRLRLISLQAVSLSLFVSTLPVPVPFEEEKTFRLPIRFPWPFPLSLVPRRPTFGRFTPPWCSSGNALASSPATLQRRASPFFPTLKKVFSAPPHSKSFYPLSDLCVFFFDDDRYTRRMSSKAPKHPSLLLDFSPRNLFFRRNLYLVMLDGPACYRRSESSLSEKGQGSPSPTPTQPPPPPPKNKKPPPPHPTPPPPPPPHPQKSQTLWPVASALNAGPLIGVDRFYCPCSLLGRRFPPSFPKSAMKFASTSFSSPSSPAR